MNDLAQLSEFLARAVPWPEDGQEFFVNAHWTAAGKNGGVFWTGRASKSHKDLVNNIKWALGLPDTRDIYVCMSGQSTAEHKTSKAGRTYLTPVRNQQNVAGLKSLYIDLDVGKADGYPDIKAAFTALGNFCREANIPRPTMVVGSGGGAHAHWLLARALMRDEWQPLANALAEATRQHGLKCDTQCTVDSARVLRPPNTWNCKLEQKRPTRFIGTPLDFDYSVERMQEALAPFAVSGSAPMVAQGVALGPLPAKLQGVAVANEFGAGVETKAPDVDLDQAALECPFLAEALATGGASYAQPLWNLTTLIATFTEGKRDDAHRMADQHPEYDPDQTDILYSRKERERLEKNIGWPKCSSILNAGCTLCKSCKHLTAGKSPLHHAPKPVALPAQVGSLPLPLPSGYSRDAAGMVSLAMRADDGSTVQVPVLDYPVNDAWLQKQPEWAINFTTTTHVGAQTQVSIPFEKITKDALVKALQGQGVVAKPSQHKRVLEFLMSFIAHLQKQKNSVVASVPYGWNSNPLTGQLDGFVYGGQIWGPGAPRPASNADAEITRQYSPHGERAPWDDAVAMVTSQGRPELNAIIASSFGAPLMMFTGHTGTLMSVFSQGSGIGKTAAIQVAQSVWGHPTFKMQLDDTTVSSANKMGRLYSLPIYWDEIKAQEDYQKFVNLIFQLTAGRERQRARADMSLAKAETWRTMIVSATNESLLDHIGVVTRGTTAGIYRIFEYEITASKTMKGFVDSSVADRTLARLSRNYGVVGLEYAKWLGANVQKCDDDMGDLLRSLNIELKSINDERFWVTSVGCVLLGARYAVELGYAPDINLDELKAFLVKVFYQMREHRNDTHVDLTNQSNVVNMLAQYANAMRPNTVFTDNLWMTRGKPRPGYVNVLGTPRDDTVPIYVHVAKNQRIMRASSTQLSEWLKQRHLPRQALMKALVSELGAKTVKGRLGGGTPYATELAEYLIEIDFSGIPGAQFIMEDDSDDTPRLGHAASERDGAGGRSKEAEDHT